MFVSLNLYTKVDGFSTGEEPRKPYSNFCINETTDKPAEEEEPPKRKSLQMRLLILNYTLKYGDTEINWVEKNCNWLHKSKKIKLEYQLGYSDQKVQMTIVARPMDEAPARLDTYDDQGNTGTPEEDNTDKKFKPYEGDLFEVCTEFDLHSVMAQTTRSLRPAKPVNTIRKYK